MSQITPVPPAYVDLAEKVDIWTAEAYLEALRELANTGVPSSSARNCRQRKACWTNRSWAGIRSRH